VHRKSGLLENRIRLGTGLAIAAVVTIWIIAAGIMYLGGLLIWRITAQVPSTTPGSVNAATISLSPPAGYAGTLITVSGQGWGPGEVVFIQLAPPSGEVQDRFSYAGAVTDESVRFTTSFTFPREERWLSLGTVRIVASASGSGRAASATFQMVAPTPTTAPTEPPPPAIPTPTSPIPSATFTPTPIPPTTTPIITDWRAEYYDNPSLTGTPVLVRNDASIDFDWGYGSPGPGLPADGFSVRWSRDLNFGGGLYRLYAHVDDGVRVWMDGQPIIGQWHNSAPTTHVADITLSDGHHSLRMEYYEHTYTAVARLWWERIEQYSDRLGRYTGSGNGSRMGADRDHHDLPAGTRRGDHSGRRLCHRAGRSKGELFDHFHFP
jgi:hypothetical protein